MSKMRVYNGYYWAVFHGCATAEVIEIFRGYAYRTGRRAYGNTALNPEKFTIKERIRECKL